MFAFTECDGPAKHSLSSFRVLVLPGLLWKLYARHGRGDAQVFAFTNHTVLPEALEKWPVSLIEKLPAAAHADHL